MKSIDVKVSARKNLGKKQSRALRLNKQIPCVLYGGKETVHFSAQENAFKNVIYSRDVFLINLDMEGEQHQAILKEVQYHPVSDNILHIDFIELLPGKPTVVSIPVNVTGSSVGVLEGGKMRQRKRYVKVKGMIHDFPESIDIDISELKIGQSVLCGDLNLDKIEILEPKRAALVSVISSRAAARSMGEEPVVEAAAAAAAETPEGAAAAAAPAAAPAPEQSKKAEQPKK